MNILRKIGLHPNGLSASKSASMRNNKDTSHQIPRDIKKPGSVEEIAKTGAPLLSSLDAGNQALASNEKETDSIGKNLVENSNIGVRSELLSGPSMTANDPGNVASPVATVKASTAEAASASRTSSLKPLDIKVPAEIDKYMVGARLGSGTCGVVHKALDNVLGREVAIKLSPVGETQISTGKVPGAQRAYQTEVYAAGRLRHPNIVTVFDAGRSNDLNFIVMEVVNGHSLKHFGKGQKLLPAYRALEVICDCCKALDYSHRQGILHRDIKPANVMIGEDGSVKLLDFGIAVGLNDESGLNRSGPTLGTPNYMSPEQILGRTLNPSSDFYSLGTVLFELLTGKQLFKARKVKDLFRTVVHQKAPSLFEFRPDLSRGLSRVLAKALSKKPDQRYQSGIEFIDALSGYIDHFKVIEQLPEGRRSLLPAIVQLPFFDSLDDADVARLIMHTRLRNLSAGQLLLGEGNFKRELLLLIDGIVGAESGTGAKFGRVEWHRLYGPGQCVGEYGFIHGARESRRYRALCSQQVLELSTETLSRLAPKLHLHYYKRVSDTLLKRIANEQVQFAPDIEL